MFDAMIAIASYTANIAHTAGTSSVSIMVAYYRPFASPSSSADRRQAKEAAATQQPLSNLRQKGHEGCYGGRSRLFMSFVCFCAAFTTQAANQLLGSAYLDQALATRLFPERGQSTHTPPQGQDHDHRRPPLTVIATTINLRKLSRGTSPEQSFSALLCSSKSCGFRKNISSTGKNIECRRGKKKLVVHVVIQSPFRCDGSRRRWTGRGAPVIAADRRGRSSGFIPILVSSLRVIYPQPHRGVSTSLHDKREC